MIEKIQWTINTPYNYDDWANESWYGNFDWQKDFIGDDQSRYLGDNGQYVDKPSRVNLSYGEKALKPGSEGWYNWIGDQVGRAKKSTAGYLELDNADYALERNEDAVTDAYKLAISNGLKILLKNPNADTIRKYGGLRDSSGASGIAGCIFESGSITPTDFAFARRSVNPDLQATWVYQSGSSHRGEIIDCTQEVKQTPGTSVQWGPSEYHDMKILLANPL